MTENELSYKIIGCALKVHSELGPGLLESSYEECLYFELKDAGLEVEKQKALPLVYRNLKLDSGYRIDLFIEKRIIVEIKAIESLTDVHLAQLLTYLKLSKSKLGLLINFHVTSLPQGIRRIKNGY